MFLSESISIQPPSIIPKTNFVKESNHQTWLMKAHERVRGACETHAIIATHDHKVSTSYLAILKESERSVRLYERVKEERVES
jgi:hypothetical protein